MNEFQYSPPQIEGQQQLFESESKINKTSEALNKIVGGEMIPTEEALSDVNELTESINREEIRIISEMIGESDDSKRKHSGEELLELAKIRNILTTKQGEYLLKMVQEEFQGLMPAPLIRTLYKEIVGRMERQREEKIEKFYSLMLIDIDRVKEINDRYGHETGDRAIELVAKAIKGSTRPEDLAGRWGGDEFMILFEGVDPEIVSKRAAQIRRFLEDNPVEFENPKTKERESVLISTSIGISSSRHLTYEKPIEKEFFELADQDLYREKQSIGCRN